MRHSPATFIIALVSQDLQLEEIRAILKHRAPTAEGITMTTIAEKLLAEGEAKGRTKGRAEGKAEGEAKGKAEAIILVLRSRGLHVEAHLRARLLSMSIEDLDAALQRAASVAAVDELLDS